MEIRPLTRVGTDLYSNRFLPCRICSVKGCRMLKANPGRVAEEVRRFTSASLALATRCQTQSATFPRRPLQHGSTRPRRWYEEFHLPMPDHEAWGANEHVQGLPALEQRDQASHGETEDRRLWPGTRVIFET